MDNLKIIGSPGNADAMLAVLKDLAKASPHAAFRAYVSPRVLGEKLEWSVTMTDTKGRRSFVIVQKYPFSSVCIKPETPHDSIQLPHEDRSRYTSQAHKEQSERQAAKPHSKTPRPQRRYAA